MCLRRLSHVGGKTSSEHVSPLKKVYRHSTAFLDFVSPYVKQVHSFSAITSLSQGGKLAPSEENDSANLELFLSVFHALAFPFP